MNILTTYNSDYFEFARIFMLSFSKNIDIDNINKLYIFDTGLTEAERDYLSYYPYVKIIDSGISLSSKHIHDKGWQIITNSKIHFLKKILRKDGIPSFVIDGDSIFINDFRDLIDFSYERWLCHCDRRLPPKSRYIGSFYGMTATQENFDFIDKWMLLMQDDSIHHFPWRESPSLSNLVEKEDNLLTQFIAESRISNVLYSNFTKESDIRIVHMKSEGKYGYCTVEERMKLPHATKYLSQYIK